MINKDKLWFITMLSVILVLGIFYLTMPNELMKTTKKSTESSSKVNATIEESDALVAMRVERDEEMVKNLEELESILTNASSSNQEKNDAYEELKNLNLTKGKEEELENKIMETFKIKAFVKMDNDTIKVVVSAGEHDVKLANKIMRSVQEEFEEKKYITVKFESYE